MSQLQAHTRAKLATRIAFLVAGFGIACWAPLVPFAKERLAVSDGVLGLLLLCLGLGSLIPMILTGILSERYGSKPVILASGLGLAILLPFLASASSVVGLGVVLALFGASLGSLDVAMNIHAVAVEKSAEKPLMSVFHALYSVGGFLGSTVMTFLLSSGIPGFTACLCCALVMGTGILFATPRLLARAPGPARQGSPFVLPHGVVILIAALAAISFLVEGAILDWSALLVATKRYVATSGAGIAYMLFAIAMTVGRLVGDVVTARLGDRNTLLWGGILAIAGIVVVLAAPLAFLALGGFVLIGLGASNIVPVLFRRGGQQSVMPPGLAIAAITTVGYAGKLIAPAAIGFIAKHLGLSMSFWLLAILLCAIPLSAARLTRREG